MIVVPSGASNGFEYPRDEYASIKIQLDLSGTKQQCDGTEREFVILSTLLYLRRQFVLTGANLPDKPVQALPDGDVLTGCSLMFKHLWHVTLRKNTHSVTYRVLGAEDVLTMHAYRLMEQIQGAELNPALMPVTNDPPRASPQALDFFRRFLTEQPVMVVEELLRWSTASVRLAPGQSIHLTRMPDNDSVAGQGLFKSHTCFHQIEVPPDSTVNTLEQFRDNLILSMRSG